MANHGFLERAFTLADSGLCRRIEYIHLALLREEYTNREVAQNGKAPSTQLHAKMRAAKSAPKPNSGTNTPQDRYTA
jgi:hypothetical protein